MKSRTILIWFSVLLFSLLGSNTLIAQEDAVAQVSSKPVLFEGTLSSRENTEGSHAIFYVDINEGDQISAMALCEAAAEDGNRLIDPALTVFAPGEGEEADSQRLQWYNDDEDSVTACIDYRSSFLTFEAPVSGTYEFMIENLANRDGPFSLEILGSTAIQADLIPANEPESETFVVESSDEPSTAVALTYSDVTVTRSFSGTLAGARTARHEIDLTLGDSIVAQVVCAESNGQYPLDPHLNIIIPDGLNSLITAVDDPNGMRCDNDQSSVYTVFKASQTGTYTFVVTNGAPEQGDYLLTITGISDTGSSSTTPIWNGTDQNIQGLWANANFEGGTGSLVVNLTSGTTVAALAVCLSDDDGNRPANPMLIVRDPNGVLIASSDESISYQACDSGYSAYVQFTAAMNGAYTFEIVESTTGVRASAVQAQAMQSAPSAINILQQLPQQSDNGNGGNNNDDGGGRDCSGSDLIGKLGAIGCVFSSSTDQGQRIDVYYIDTNSRGHYMFHHYVNQLGDAPASDTQVGNAQGGPYTFTSYHRSSGDLRITGGPSSEGKIYEVIVPLLTGSSNSGGNNGGNNNGGGNNNDNNQQNTAPTYVQYVVQTGDTLYSIASRFGVSVDAIAQANGIGSDNIIHVGNTLNIPSP